MKKVTSRTTFFGGDYWPLEERNTCIGYDASVADERVETNSMDEEYYNFTTAIEGELIEYTLEIKDDDEFEIQSAPLTEYDKKIQRIFGKTWQLRYKSEHGRSPN